jgi:predicted RecB family nuclease
VDMLKDVRSVPFVVNGALAFGIKHIAKALYKHGKIATKWEDGVSDGLSAQIGIWRALDEAKAKGIPVMEARFMQEIVQYNEVDCRAMMEILKVMRGLPVPGLN